MNQIDSRKLNPAVKMAVCPKPCAVSRRKSRLLFLSAALILLILICVLTSVGQILQSRKNRKSVGANVQDMVAANPVFSPILPRYLRPLQFSPGANVIYRSDAPMFPSIPAEAAWWEAENEVETEELFQDVASPRPRLSGRLEYRAVQRPSQIFKPSSPAGDLISWAAADLLNLLRERELKSEEGDQGVNPFEEALKDSSSEEAKEDKKKDSQSEKTKKEQPKDASNSREEKSLGGAQAQNRNYLFIGLYNGQIATSVGTSELPLLDSAVFTFPETGEQSFDLDVVLRNREGRESVAFGDLSGDGILDLVVTNKMTGEAVVYINDGYGNFVPRSSISGGRGPGSAAIVDFSGDGSPDVAVLIQNDRRIVVDGKGLRRFIFYPSSDTADSFDSMLPYDFDGDGLPDLLLNKFEDRTTVVYRNQGQALFAAAETLPIQSFPLAQSIVDLTGDAIPETVFVQHVGDHVSIAIRNGVDGTTAGLATTILHPSLYYVVGDFNQDGIVDISIARRK